MGWRLRVRGGVAPGGAGWGGASGGAGTPVRGRQPALAIGVKNRVPEGASKTVFLLRQKRPFSLRKGPGATRGPFRSLSAPAKPVIRVANPHGPIRSRQSALTTPLSPIRADQSAVPIRADQCAVAIPP